MSAKNRISRILSGMLPGGVLGASMVLASASAAASVDKSSSEAQSPQQDVAAQLEAIRAGVTALGVPAATDAAGSAEITGEDAPRTAATWWGNGGWGRWRFGWHNGGFGWPNWHNWHNWNNWGNGGNPGNNWGNGGPNWGNGGWHNFWHNA